MRRVFAAVGIAALTAAPASLKAQNKDVESVVSSAPVEDATGPSASLGADVSTGKYGSDESTRTLIFPVSLRVPVAKNLTFLTSLAWIQISGANVVIGPDGRPTLGIGSNRSTRSGLGDLTLGAVWDVPVKSDHWSIQTSARVKVPTAARAKVLSSGKPDFAGKLEVTYIAGQLAPFASVEYQVIGRPEGVDLRNAINSSVGFAWISGKNAFITSYDYNQSTSPLVNGAHSLFGAFSAPISDKVRLTFYGIKGLSTGSADIQAGTSASFRF